MKTVLLLLVLRITLSHCAECFWTNCQSDHRPQQGCSEYNGCEKIKRMCKFGHQFFCCAQENCVEKVNITAETKFGTLEGIEGTSRNGRIYFGFLGIRYAQPPKRFQTAKPPNSWSGILEAKNFGSKCPQISVPDGQLVGEEDCLYLNVYSPNLQGQLPVMVFIHGGRFIWGAGQNYEAKYLMDENIILVTINYRLGALGFLYTGDSQVPGNIGFKDTVMALRWIKDNINGFGGNPNQVTIFGESAGAALVAFHMLSPISADLFQYAISESGTALCSWALQRDPETFAKQLGKVLGCSTENTSALVNCLKSKKYIEIVEAQTRLPLDGEIISGHSVVFSLVVETHISQSEPTFPYTTPYKLMTSGQVNRKPWIIGFNLNEGTLYSTPVIHNATVTEEFNDNWYFYGPIQLFYERTGGSNAAKYSISYDIFQTYFGDGEISPKTWDRYSDMLTDRIFLQGIIRTIYLQSVYSPVYAYVITYKGNFSYSNYFNGVTDAHGVTHFDELQYLFNSSNGANELMKGTPDGDFSSKFVNLWTTFAKTGKPQQTWNTRNAWTPVDTQTHPIKFYRIDKETMFSSHNFDNRVKFWDNLPLAEFAREKK